MHKRLGEHRCLDGARATGRAMRRPRWGPTALFLAYIVAETCASSLCVESRRPRRLDEPSALARRASAAIAKARAGGHAASGAAAPAADTEVAAPSLGSSGSPTVSLHTLHGSSSVLGVDFDASTQQFDPNPVQQEAPAADEAAPQIPRIPIGHSNASALEVRLIGSQPALAAIASATTAGRQEEQHGHNYTARTVVALPAVAQARFIDGAAATRELLRKLRSKLHSLQDGQCLMNPEGDRVGCVADCSCGVGARCYPRFVLVDDTQDPFTGKQWFNIGVCDVDMRLPLLGALGFFTVLFLGFLVCWRRTYPMRPKEYAPSLPWEEAAAASFNTPQDTSMGGPSAGGIGAHHHHTMTASPFHHVGNHIGYSGSPSARSAALSSGGGASGRPGGGSLAFMPAPVLNPVPWPQESLPLGGSAFQPRG